MNCQLTNFLESENILNPQQYGFRKDKSTSHTLAGFTDSVLEALNDGDSVLGIFLDFSKAFDTIDHRILIDKLKSLNFSNTSVTLISNYLSNRKQLIMINSHFSNLNDITCGVAQGSILGPTLFLIYINDLPTITKLLDPILYADDTNLFFRSKNLNSHINTINDELELIKNWCNLNKLTLNLENKTNYLV